ncbi:uncharacterized protein PS065_021614 [Dugong dugon]
MRTGSKGRGWRVPPPHSPTSPLKKHPKQGRTRVFLILLGASRPQPREHPHSRANGGRRSRSLGSLGAGVQGGSPGSGGGGGQSRYGGSEQRTAALRAGGSQLRGDPGGLGTARSRVIQGPKCQPRGLRAGGFRDALCTEPPPPPPSSTLGSLGWDQAFSSQSAAALEPEPGAQPPPPDCRKAACAFATARGGVPIAAGTGLRLASLTPTSASPLVASEAPPLAEGLRAVAKRHCTPNGATAHAEGGDQFALSMNYGAPEGAGVLPVAVPKRSGLSQVSGR